MDTLTERYASINPGEIVANIKIALQSQITTTMQLARTLNHRKEILKMPGAIRRLEDEYTAARESITALNAAQLDAQEFILHLARAVQPAQDIIRETKLKSGKKRYSVTNVPATVKVQEYNCEPKNLKPANVIELENKRQQLRPVKKITVMLQTEYNDGTVEIGPLPGGGLKKLRDCGIKYER